MAGRFLLSNTGLKVPQARHARSKHVERFQSRSTSHASFVSHGLCTVLPRSFLLQRRHLSCKKSNLNTRCSRSDLDPFVVVIPGQSARDSLVFSSRTDDVLEQQFRETSESIRRMQSLIEESQKQMQQGSAETYRRESKAERTFNGGYERRYYSESVTIYGAPAPYTTYEAPPAEALSGALLTAALLGAVIAAYAAGAVRFLRGYDNTRFKTAKKWQLALLWPVLIVFSRSFRKEFWTSVRRGGSGTPEPLRKDLTGPEDLGPTSTAQRVER